MQFSNFTRVEQGNKISFYTKSPLKGISSIKYFKDNATGNFSKKEFRWSFNSDYWSAWTPLNQGNLSQVKITANQNIFLEIRYFSSGNGIVTEFELFYTGAAQSEISAGSCPPDSKYSKIDKTVPTEVYIPSQCNSEPGCTDAMTLCGKSCDYYLWRPNHKGQQPISSITDLQTILNNLYNAFQNIEVQGAENIAGDGIGVFYELNNKILYFKRINAGYGLNISELDGTITLTVDPSLSTKDPSINQLYDLYGILESEINDLSTYTNSQFIQIDSSVTDLYFKYWNSESSIGELYDFYNLIETNISDISIYVDSKFAEIDSSIIDLYLKYWDAESSINDLYIKYGNADASINELYSLIGDTSIKWLENVGPGAEVLKEIDGAGIGKFRTLVGGGDVSIVEQGDQITIYIDADVSVHADPWEQSEAVSADVGGINIGDIITLGTSPTKVLERILYEYFPPDVSLWLDPSPGPTSLNGYYEKWVDAPISNGVVLTYSFSNASFSKIRVFDVSYYENGIELGSDSWGGATSGGNSILVGSPAIGVGWDNLIYNFSFQNKVDSISMNDYDVSIALNWVNPYFYGTVSDSVNYTNISNADILGLNKLIAPEQTNEISYDVSSNFVKLKFVYAYPATYGNLKSIFDVKNDFNVTTSFDSSIIDVKMSGLSGPGPPIPYKVYIKNHWISFTPDVSIFKLIFNI